MNNIRVGCSVLIKSNNKLLLGIRNKEPNKGMIITPGGGVELFERMEDTVKREIMEETGLEITNIKQLKTYEIINKPDEHRIIIYWSADYDKNSVQSATDLADAKFYSKEEIKEKLKIFITRYQAKEAKEQIQYYRKGKISEEERNILKEMEIRIDQLDFDEAEILMKRWEGME